MQLSRTCWLRRILATTAAAGLAAAGVAGRAGADPPPAIPPGTGTAVAQTVKVDPRAGNLSLGITAGIALADYTNKVARAEARAVDLGVIGTTLASEPCDGGEPTLPADRQPQPLHAETGDPGAAEGLSATDAGVATKRVQATDQPLGVAETVTAPFGLPGVIEIGGGRARSEAGIVDGARLARAVTEIGQVRIAGGLVTLRGLRWEAVHTSGPGGPSLTFSLGGASVAGLALPTDGPGGVDAVIEAANQALAPLGIRVLLPVARTSGGVAFLDPLTVSVVPAQARDDVLGAAVSALQPLREAAFAPLVEGCTELSKNGKSAVTVFDVALGSLTGAGSFSLALGGVQATTGEIAFSNVLGGLGSGPGSEAGLGEGSPSAPPSDLARVSPGPTPSTAPAPPTTAAPPLRSEQAAPVAARGGAPARAALALAALATLAATVAAAGADWRLLRRRAATTAGTEGGT